MGRQSPRLQHSSSSLWRVLGSKVPVGRVSCQQNKPALVPHSAPSLGESSLQEVWPQRDGSQQLEPSVKYVATAENFVFS